MSFYSLPIDIIEIIAVKSGVQGWIALQRVCRYFAKLTLDKKVENRIIRKFITCNTDINGYKRYYVNNKLHNIDDKPAVINDYNGYKAWYHKNRLHRNDDKPAIIYSNGNTEWLIHGKIHRDYDRPAIIYPDFCICWYNNGVIYRQFDKSEYLLTEFS